MDDIAFKVSLLYIKYSSFLLYLVCFIFRFLSLFFVKINNALTFFFYHVSGFCFCL